MNVQYDGMTVDLKKLDCQLRAFEEALGWVDHPATSLTKSVGRTVECKCVKLNWSKGDSCAQEIML